MSKFTKGKWNYMVRNDSSGVTVIRIASEDKKLGLLYGAKTETEANARLVAAAPEMYELVQWFAFGNCDKCMSLMVSARELLARIDGKEDGHEE